jgi:hypothetical protein
MNGSDVKQCIALGGLILLAAMYDGEILLLVAGSLIGVLGVGVYNRVVK